MRARAHYVRGVKLAYPYAGRLVSGPFEDSERAFAEAKRLRPLYPDANLEVVPYSGRALPVRVPRGANAAAVGTEHTLRSIEGRRLAAEALALHARGFGATVVLEDWDGEPDVDITVWGLRANIWLAWLPAAPMPIISWVAQEGRKLRPALPGAWEGEGFPHYKATSIPADWPALFDALEIGICGGIDGSAFE